MAVSSQNTALESLMSDPVMQHASISMTVVNQKSGEIILEQNPDECLIPASVMKLITTAAALELLGPDYTFKTQLGYTGTINTRSGKLNGDIVIIGGGDPALGSEHFTEHYGEFIDEWVRNIKKQGIRSIEGKVISDDSRYDYLPAPSKWLWEDVGNYYGAGTYGLSLYDNTYQIHFKTTTGSSGLMITEISPSECRYEFSNWLTAEGSSDQGYMFAAPYSTNGWLAGKIPENKDDFVLKASVTDPPELIAKILSKKLRASGITISKEPTTIRSEQKTISDTIVIVTETISPPLSKIIEKLNHESINLYAEHLVKELGVKYKGSGSTLAGLEVISEFFAQSGIETSGIFMEDGSGLSPLNAINSRELTHLLQYMKSGSKYFSDFLSSLPEAAKEGTLKYYFKDTVFDGRLVAKSGSMTRVRSYAGYMTTLSGENLTFAIIINNFSGSSGRIVAGIENILKELILNK